MSNEILAEYSRMGFKLQVYANRIEIEERGALFAKKKTVIPIRNIATVEKSRAVNKLTVKTNDGKKHQWVTGLKTGQLYDTIMEIL